MKLIIYQAECGDALRIEFTGSDRQTHHILIDSGFERTYRNILHAELKELENTDQSFDLCIISHIHDDHIGGAIAYIRSIKNKSIPDIVQQWIYNPPRGNGHKKNFIQEISTAKSIAQGDVLASYLKSIKKLSSQDFTNEIRPTDLYGLKLTFLSPDKTSLKALRTKYPEGKRNPFEREESTDISLAKAKLKSDYHIRLKDFSLTHTTEDISVENGSSIAVLVEHNGIKFLNLADSHPSVIVTSLKNAGYTESEPLICNWVKVAHHGSKENNLSQLYDMILCNHFIISSNGINKYKLPAKQCLATIIRSSKRTKATCHLYFTYDTPALREIFKIDGDSIFDELNFRVHFSGKPHLVFQSK